MKKLINDISQDLKLVKFLLSQEEEYKSKLTKRMKAALYLFFGFVGLDLLKVTPTGTMPNETQWVIRISGIGLIFYLLYLSFICLTRSYFKKWKNIRNLPSVEIEKFNRYYGK